MEEKVKWNYRGTVRLRKRRSSQNIQNRFEKYYIPEPNSGCWLWFGPSSHSFGYGTLHINKRPETAHRISWQLVNGPIPAGKMVCHKCDNPPCVNPDHLYLGTPADNAHDREKRGRGRSGSAKLTREQVIEIFNSPDHYSVICKRYDISESVPRKIKSGALWRKITMEL